MSASGSRGVSASGSGGDVCLWAWGCLPLGGMHSCCMEIHFVRTTDSHIFGCLIKIFWTIACRELGLKDLLLQLDTSSEQGNCQNHKF